MFEKASRLKLRFKTSKGEITVEDLWDLPLTSETGRPNLNDIAKSLYRQIKDNEVETFVPTNGSSRKDSTLQLSFDLVKYVIDTKIAERQAAELKRVNQEKKAKILSIIEQKQNDQLSNASIEELTKMLNDL